VEIQPSARRHGVDPLDIKHAIEHALAADEIGDDPRRFLVLGPERAGNLLEIVVVDRSVGPTVIHAMAMRPQYIRLLPKGSR
jgi:hypothetical protein